MSGKTKSGVTAVLLAGLAAAGTDAAAFGEKATAEIKDKAGNAIGRADLVGASGGVLVTLRVSGLPPGRHAVRIHDAGKCEGDFVSAGEIYNPLGARYGFLNEEGPMAGELPNVHAGTDGTIDAELINHFISLETGVEEPLLDQDGASIVIYDKPGDHISDPDGNAGARIACGIVTVTK